MLDSCGLLSALQNYTLIFQRKLYVKILEIKNIYDLKHLLLENSFQGKCKCVAPVLEELKINVVINFPFY